MRLAVVAALVLVGSCMQPSARQAGAETTADALDTALVRRLCLPEADSLLVDADSLMSLPRRGCVLRDQRRPTVRIF